jgi:sodium transport system permease protein
MILAIFRKELLDTLRDRRTLITSILIPILVFPLLFGLITKIASSQEQTARDRTITIGLSATGGEGRLKDLLLKKGDLLFEKGSLRIREGLDLEAARALIAADSLDGMIQFDPQFERQVQSGIPGRISFFYRESSKGRVERQRVQEVLKAYEKELTEARLQSLGLDPRLDLHPVEITSFNLASQRERIALAIGGFLPYMFIIFSFVGCMHPAMDLTAGEKERGTLETLLTLPATRLQILSGKFLVVVLMGLFSVVLTFGGLLAGVRTMDRSGAQLTRQIGAFLELDSALLVVSLVLPLVVFFAAAVLTVSIYAKSYKEAQALTAPGMFVVIVPVVISLLPGIELTDRTALIPIMNVSLATKAILAGTITPTQLALVYTSLIGLAGLSLYGCARMFERESAVFRS